MRKLQAGITIGHILRALRLVRGLRQMEVAQAAGISPAVLSNLENGWREPRQDELLRLLQALGVRQQESA